MISLSILVLVFCSATSHNIIYSRPQSLPRNKYYYQVAQPAAAKSPYYYKTRPLFVGYPGIYVPHIVALSTKAPVQQVTTAEPKEDNNSGDLYGCGTEYGPWWTPDYCRRYLLHWSATSGNINLAKKLLMEGRDINLQHNVERTALHIASHWGRATMVKFLIRRGADPNLKDMWGYKALELAEFRKCDNETYNETWSRSCNGAENNYPVTIEYLKAGCEMLSCVWPFQCVDKQCVKVEKNYHKNQYWQG